MRKSLCGWIVLASVFVICRSDAAERVKANNSDNLNASSSWIGGAVPVWNDTAKWNNTVLGANSPALGGNVSVLGVIIDNPGGAVTINGANTLQTGFRGADLSSATADLTLSMNNLALMEFAGVIWNVGAGRVMTVNASTLTRGYGSSVVVQGSGVVTSTVMVNDPTGVIAPWARIGTGSATRYATMSGGSVAGYAGGAAAATAGDITDVTGTVNYDLAGVGTWGSGPSFNTLRYTGSSGTVAGAYSANGILNAGSGTLILSGASTIGKDKELVITSPDDTRRVALSGVVGDSDEGASGLTVTGNGRVDLTADNSYTGQTVVNAGQLFVSNDNALGTTNGSTVIYVNGSRSTGGQLVLRGSVTLLEPLTFVGPGDGNPWHQALRVDSGGGTNTLAGPITIEGRGVRLTAGGSGTTLNINAPLTRTSSGTALILGAGGAGGVVNVNATINNNSGSLELHNGPGLVRINSKENNFGTLNVQTDHLTQLGVSDAFVNWCNLSVGGSPFTSGNQARGTFDLAGYSQAFNSFNGNGVVGEPPSTRVITNSSVVLSTLTSGSSGGSGTFNGIFSGNIAYVKNGAGTQNLIHLNSYTGGTTVNGGTLVLNNASNHGSLSVNNGTFRFSPSLIVNGNLSGTGGTIDTGPAGSTLTVEQSSYSTFNGVLSNSGSLIKNGQGTLVINGANTYSGGTTINSGLLVFGQPASIPSSGSITANAGSNLGMGVGGASSFTSDDVDALWAGTYPGVVPPAGALVAVDTAQGDFTYATSHADTRGLVKSGANTLRLTGVNTYTGGTVIQGGALTIPLTSALPGWNVDGAYAVWPDAALAVENTVTDTEVAMILGTTNFAAGACIGFDTGSGNRSYAENIGNTSQGALGLYKAGINTLSLSGANSYDGNTIVAGGILAIYNSSSLGSAAGYTRVMRAGGTSGSYYTDSTGQLQLNGSSGDIILDEDFIITGAEQYGYTGAIRNISGNNAINGRIKIENSARIASSGGRLTLNGKISGAAGSSNPMLVFSVDSREIIISNRIDIGTGQLYCHGGGTVVLAAANNFVGDVLVQYGCTLRLEANSPIAKGSPLLLGNNPEGTGKLELNGFDQEVRGLRSGGTAASLPNNLVRNSHAADESTFSVTQTAGMNEIFQGRIIDAITFIKGGANNSVLTLGGANSFSGSTIVRGGTLALDAVGTLGENCTNVVVDAGTLKLQNSAAIADTATLSLAAGGGAKVDLASGVNESVRYLFIDGEMQRCGTYGSSASAAANKNDVYFSGTGVLKVLRDNGGTVIIVR